MTRKLSAIAAIVAATRGPEQRVGRDDSARARRSSPRARAARSPGFSAAPGGHLRGHCRALRERAGRGSQPRDRLARQHGRADRRQWRFGADPDSPAATTRSSGSTRTIAGDLNPALAGHPNIPTGVSRNYAKGNLMQFSGHGIAIDATAPTQQRRWAC